jgi:ribosomal protein S18 acetylase RimI-like enzyme
MVRHVSIDAAALRFLERHETTAHALPTRTVRDLGDALLLTDPLDPDPFWNRAVSLRWPSEPEAFDHRLAELISLFGMLGRRPHVWPSPAHNEPSDLAARLISHGFRDAGAGHLMVLVEADRSAPVRPEELPPETTLTLAHCMDDPTAVADGAAAVLVDAFEAGAGRQEALREDLAIVLSDPRVAVATAHVGGVPAAVCKATPFDGATYLSSIGTAVPFRGRGLAALVTRAAIAHGRAVGSTWHYLGVFSGNETALRVYDRLGFATLGVAPDLLLE